MFPKPFGFKTHYHIKKRFAKKLIQEKGRNLWNRYKQFHNYTGLVNGCTGLNFLPIEINPIYWYSKDGKKSYLMDIELVGKKNSCSFYHCGIDKPKTLQECQDFLNKIANGPDDKWDFKERYSKIELDINGCER